MEQLDFIIRERKKADNRVVLVKLTPLGRNVAAQCQEAGRRHEAMLTRGLAPDELALLKRLLRQAYDNVHAGSACIAEEPRPPAKTRARKRRPLSSGTSGTEP